MKKLPLVLLIAIVLVGGAVVATSTPSSAQFYEYQAPPPNPYTQPWVGSNTPWVYFNGDWFLNGILYYFFGPQYGWAPYYAYPPVYIVRPQQWYAPMWQTWYRGHPTYWNHFRQAYPYWRSHRVGQHYDERFYEKHQHGRPGDWQKGYRGVAPERPHPEGRKPGPAQVAPPARPGPVHGAPPERQKPPTRVTPPERQMPGPARVAPPAGQKPGPAQVAPPAGQRPPAQMAPPAGPKPGPAPAPKAGPAPKAAPSAPQPEKGGHGEEKH